MSTLIDGVIKAFELLASFDPEVYGTMLLSLRISGFAVILGSLCGVPVGAMIGLRQFSGKSLVVNLINTLMGVPPVVVGLVVYLLLSYSGPLGFLNLLYTPSAMILAQLIMVVPIVAGITISAVTSVHKNVKDTAQSLGVTPWQMIWLVISEARTGLMTSIITAFGAAISEVGAIMMVGGNIRYYTRSLTTTIVFQTGMGELEVAIALGIILLALAFAVNLGLTRLQLRS